MLPATPGARRLQTWPHTDRDPARSRRPPRGAVTGSRGWRSAAATSSRRRSSLVGQVKAGSRTPPWCSSRGTRPRPRSPTPTAVALWAEVHPDAAVRDRADELSQQVQKYVTELGLDRDLYAVFDRLATSSDSGPRRRRPPGARAHAARLPPRRRRPRRRHPRPAARAERARASSCRQEFGRNIRDDVRVDPARARAARRAARRLPRRPPGRRGRPRHASPPTTPTSYPFMTFGSDAEARRELALAQNNVAWPANDQVLQDLLAVRRETRRRCSATTLARLRRRGQDDRHRRGDRRLHRPDRRRGRPSGPARRGDVLLERKRVDDPDADAVDDLRLALLRRAGPARAVRRRRARSVRTYFDFEQVRQACSTSPAGSSGSRGRRSRATTPAPGTTTSRRTTSTSTGDAHRADLPRPAPARGQVQARRAVRPGPRRRRPAARPRACWSATSRAA